MAPKLTFAFAGMLLLVSFSCLEGQVIYNQSWRQWQAIDNYFFMTGHLLGWVSAATYLIMSQCLDYTTIVTVNAYARDLRGASALMVSANAICHIHVDIVRVGNGTVQPLIIVRERMPNLTKSITANLQSNNNLWLLSNYRVMKTLAPNEKMTN